MGIARHIRSARIRRRGAYQAPAAARIRRRGAYQAPAAARIRRRGAYQAPATARTGELRITVFSNCHLKTLEMGRIATGRSGPRNDKIDTVLP